MKEKVVPLIPIGLGEVMCKGYDATTEDRSEIVVLELYNKHSGEIFVDLACYTPEGIDVVIGWLQHAKERLVSKKQ